MVIWLGPPPPVGPVPTAPGIVNEKVAVAIEVPLPAVRVTG
jgi:hypothetical protein